MTELSPAAHAVLDAIEKDKTIYGMPLLRPLIAAALRAVADQVAPSDANEPRNSLPMAMECQRIRAEIFAIANELEAL
jgi:hypothetical protein